MRLERWYQHRCPRSWGDMEIPGDGESFRHKLNDPGSEDWAVICLDGRQIEGDVFSEYVSHHGFPGGGESLLENSTRVR